MKRLLPVAAAVGTVLYPFVLYVTYEKGGAQILALVLAVIYLGRSIIVRDPGTRLYQLGSYLLICFLLLSVFVHNEMLMLFVPALAGLNVLVVFAYTLIFPPSIIEIIAVRMGNEMNEAGEIYCRRVTIIWCVFLTVNCLIAVWTALWSSLETWTFYNGFLSYVLTGLLFGAEYLYRQAYRKRFLQAS